MGECDLDLAQDAPKAVALDVIVETNDDKSRSFATASARLEEIFNGASQDGPTLEWLLTHLFERSPEFLLLLFMPLAVTPGTSPVAGMVLMVVALPLMLHRRVFFVPDFLARRRISPMRLERALNGAMWLLKRYERFALAHPHPPARTRNRLAGFLVLVLSLALMVPLPLSNVLPGLTVGLVALASLEGDDQLLWLAAALTAGSFLLILWEASSVLHLATWLAN